MEINLLIRHYSDFLSNLSFTLSRVVNEIYDTKHCDLFNSDYLENRAIFCDFILTDIEHVRKNIIYLTNLFNKKGV